MRPKRSKREWFLGQSQEWLFWVTFWVIVAVILLAMIIFGLAIAEAVMDWYDRGRAGGEHHCPPPAQVAG